MKKKITVTIKWAIYKGKIGLYAMELVESLEDAKYLISYPVLCRDPGRLPVIVNRVGGMTSFDRNAPSFVEIKVLPEGAEPLTLEEQYPINSPDFVYGFISPDGLTVQCLYEGHMRCAEAIWKQYYPDEHARYEVDALVEKGWIEILRDDDESVWINANRRRVTKPQAEALITVGHDKSPRAHSIIVASEKYW